MIPYSFKYENDGSFVSNHNGEPYYRIYFIYWVRKITTNGNSSVWMDFVSFSRPAFL